MYTSGGSASWQSAQWLLGATKLCRSGKSPTPSSDKSKRLDRPDACMRLFIVPEREWQLEWGTRRRGTVDGCHAPCARLACTQWSTGTGVGLLVYLSVAQAPPAACSVCAPYAQAALGICCSCCRIVLCRYTDVTRFPRYAALLPVLLRQIAKQRFQCLKITCRLRCPEAAVLVAANQDAYVSRQSVIELAEHWPGCEVRWVEGGHVSAFLMQQPAFRTAILDSLNRLPRKP